MTRRHDKGFQQTAASRLQLKPTASDDWKTRVKAASWNMGCAPRQAVKYRRKHLEAWRYLVEDLRPDVCFVQEALRSVPVPGGYQLIWGEAGTSDSGTALLIRQQLEAEPWSVSCSGSYLAGARVRLANEQVLLLSVHVGPPNYRKNLRALAEYLSEELLGQSFVVAGDFNAARHLDDVQGGRWFTRFFDDFIGRGFHDCHWSLHGREVQSFWGHQARHQYQCDHVFVDEAVAQRVASCFVLDNEIVRSLSDHGPLVLEFD